jgi:catechol 2,3-dioxygenase-like lactoylglutathione lyase family enzyme
MGTPPNRVARGSLAEDHGREIRAYIRDPDGHLIEAGQATARPGPA